MPATDIFWPVRIKGDVVVSVPPTVQSMTSYVLLEQEDWFEDEMDFVRALVTPDMHAFDIGANHGVYALSIAKGLETGHVWAFEPTIAPGSMLARSIGLNGVVERLTWVHAGLSDHDGSAEISVSGNSETNSLHTRAGRKERIELETLDGFIARQGIEARIDFVKLDAEGEEIAILKGGQDFFTRQSPLIMFELRHGNAVNHGLIEAVEALGYGLYRLLPGPNMLVEYDPAFREGFLLNLFACKPGRAAELASRNLLAREADIQTAASLPLDDSWQNRLLALPFARRYQSEWLEHAPRLSPDHDFALSATLLANDQSVPAPRRTALLREALAKVNAIAEAGKGDVALWLLRLSLTHAMGERNLSLAIAAKLANLPPETMGTLKLPFPPPAPRFRDYDFGANYDHLPDILKEFIQYRQSFSSCFGNQPPDTLSALSANPGHGQEIDRRQMLMAKRRGLPAPLPRNHDLFTSEQSPNREIWRILARN